MSPTTARSGARCCGFPGGVIRVDPGRQSAGDHTAEYYEVPFNEPKAAINGFGPRGMDIDRNGVVWIPLASGHLASFDRKKCKGPLNGPTATGRHCPGRLDAAISSPARNSRA